MLVRAGDTGEWLQLTPVEGMPSGGFRSLCGADAANLLELDEPLPVAAYGPWPHGSLAGVDAVCLTASGDIELLVGTWGEEPRDTLWRMLDVAGALRGTTLEAFASHLELGEETSVTRWLHQRVGGDATRLETRLREVLETGDFGFVLVTSAGAGDLAQPLQFVQQGNVRIRVFEVEVLRAGEVQAIEGIEVPLAGAETEQVAAQPATTSAPAPQPPVLTVVPEPEAFEPEVAAEAEASQPEFVEPIAEAPAEVEPVAESAPEPEAESEVEPEAETFLDEPEAEDLPAAPEDPSDLDSFFASVDRLDHRTSAHLRWLHDALLRLVDEAEYTTDGDRQFVTGWMHGTERLPLYLLDSRGLLQLVIASLPDDEQREYADEVAGMLPETTGTMLLKAGYADIDIPAHLDDQTLLEYLVDNLVEALPGGREAFGTQLTQPAAEESTTSPDGEGGDEHDGEDDGGFGFELATATEPTPAPEADADTSESSLGGEDFFAGVSAGHDASDVETAVAGLGGDKDTPVAETTPEPDPVPEPARDWSDRSEQSGKGKSGGSRWLRRRGAA